MHNNMNRVGHLISSHWFSGYKFAGHLLVGLMAVLIVSTALWSQQLHAEAVESPVVMLEKTSQQVIKILQDDAEQLRSDPNRTYQIVDEYILPHLDDVTMAKLALGKSWKKATREQKLAFVSEFRNLLVRTYSRSLVEFSDQKITFFPVKLAPDTTRASVRAEVIQPGGPSILMVYRVRLKDNAWKVYDIKIEGVSLVTSYRGTFTQQVRSSGMDGLLDYMRAQNKNLSSAGRSESDS